MRPTLRSALFAIAAVGSGALIAIGGCNTSNPPPGKAAMPGNAAQQPAPPPPTSEAVPASFVGDLACAECHAKAFREHKDSFHSKTLLAAGRKSLGALAPPVGPIPGTNYLIQADGDKLYFGLKGKPAFRQPLDVGIGSGKTGITFASFTNEMPEEWGYDKDGLLRVRMSWFPSTRKWYVTPMDEKLTEKDMPNGSFGTAARGCLACHTTTLPSDTIVPERRFYGVGCESCHGPGSAHIAAAHTKRTAGSVEPVDLKVERLGKLGAARLIELCDRCHGSVEPIKRKEGMQVSVRVGQLRQTVGLTDSLCFQKSGNKLSCITCHQPHTDAKRDTRFYESVCQSCHAPHPSGSPVTPEAASTAVPNTASSHPAAPRAASKPCLVQPAGNCLNCHMPSRRVFTDDRNRPTKMTDHCIRRFRPKEGVPGLTAD